jgi:hypothetical protein
MEIGVIVSQLLFFPPHASVSLRLFYCQYTGSFSPHRLEDLSDVIKHYTHNTFTLYYFWPMPFVVTVLWLYAWGA